MQETTAKKRKKKWLILPVVVLLLFILLEANSEDSSQRGINNETKSSVLPEKVDKILNSLDNQEVVKDYRKIFMLADAALNKDNSGQADAILNIAEIMEKYGITTDFLAEKVVESLQGDKDSYKDNDDALSEQINHVMGSHYLLYIAMLEEEIQKKYPPDFLPIDVASDTLVQAIEKTGCKKQQMNESEKWHTCYSFQKKDKQMYYMDCWSKHQINCLGATIWNHEMSDIDAQKYAGYQEDEQMKYTVKVYESKKETVDIRTDSIMQKVLSKTEQDIVQAYLLTGLNDALTQEQYDSNFGSWQIWTTLENKTICYIVTPFQCTISVYGEKPYSEEGNYLSNCLAAMDRNEEYQEKENEEYIDISSVDTSVLKKFHVKK